MEALRLETIEAGTLELLKKLMRDPELVGFNLVGGTALALQLGHRKSVDLDLFSLREFDSGKMEGFLKEKYNAEILALNDHVILSHIGKVKVDLVNEPHPLIDNLERTEGLRMLSIRDIGAMKMYAVHEDGGRLKDFADIHALLEKHPLNTYLEYARLKYPELDPGRLKRLLYNQPSVDLDMRVQYIGKPVEWHEMVGRLREAFRDPAKIFSEAHQLKNEQNIHKKPRLRRGPRL